MLGLLGSSLLADALADDGKRSLEGLRQSHFAEITSRESEAGMTASDSSGCSNSERSRIEKEGLQDSGRAAGKETRIYPSTTHTEKPTDGADWCDRISELASCNRVCCASNSTLRIRERDHCDKKASINATTLSWLIRCAKRFKLL